MWIQEASASICLNIARIHQLGSFGAWTSLREILPPIYWEGFTMHCGFGCLSRNGVFWIWWLILRRCVFTIQYMNADIRLSIGLITTVDEANTRPTRKQQRARIWHVRHPRGQCYTLELLQFKKRRKVNTTVIERIHNSNWTNYYFLLQNSVEEFCLTDHLNQTTKYQHTIRRWHTGSTCNY